MIRSLALPRHAKILDVGCGNGLFFAKLGQFGNVWGIEIDQSLIPPDSPYRDRIFVEPLGHARYHGLRFDLITALDVVEHMEDDRQAVDEMFAMLRPGGKLIITVPASMKLWDRHDEINGHYRRYSRKTLRELISGNGRIVCLETPVPRIIRSQAAGENAQCVVLSPGGAARHSPETAELVDEDALHSGIPAASPAAHSVRHVAVGRDRKTGARRRRPRRMTRRRFT